MQEANHNHGAKSAESQNQPIKLVQTRIHPDTQGPRTNIQAMREIPELGWQSRLILGDIVGNTEGFLEEDGWSQALVTAAAEALDIANVLGGGKSRKENQAELKSRFADMSEYTEEQQRRMKRMINSGKPAPIIVDVFTYRRSNSGAGAYGLHLSSLYKSIERSAYYPKISDLELDRAAMIAAHELCAAERGASDPEQGCAVELARWLSALWPEPRVKGSGSQPVRERIRNARLENRSDPQLPLDCKCSVDAVETECLELALRSYWSRKSNG